jgi:hypothetical protein
MVEVENSPIFLTVRLDETLQRVKILEMELSTRGDIVDSLRGQIFSIKNQFYGEIKGIEETSKSQADRLKVTHLVYLLFLRQLLYLIS